MKRKTFLVVVAAAIAGYFLAKDKAEKEMIKRLIKENVFEGCNGKEKNQFDEFLDKEEV
jgi:hypothetical protein